MSRNNIRIIKNANSIIKLDHETSPQEASRKERKVNESFAMILSYGREGSLVKDA